jgi:hypothetical protein
VVLLRTSSPDLRLTDLLNPARAPLVLAFRDAPRAGRRQRE